MANPLSIDLDHILNHTRDVWEQVRGERIFITGGTGFFGCWLLESFCWANDRLDLHASATVLSRDPQAFARKAPNLAAHQAIELYAGDVRSFDFPDGEFSHIVHAATESSGIKNAQKPLAMLDTIVEGTRHTLEFARKSRTEKFLLTSSGAIYGKQPSDLPLIPEEYIGAPNPIDPGSVYGEGKRLAEHLCTLYGQQYGIQTKIARCFAFVGPFMPLDTHFAIGNFIRDGLNGGPIVIQGDGTPLRSYLYGADLAIWLWTILFRGNALRPYNVGSELAISIANLAKVVAGLSEPKLEISICCPVSVNSAAERYVPSTETARKELNLFQWIDLETAIDKTCRWYSETHL